MYAVGPFPSIRCMAMLLVLLVFTAVGVATTLIGRRTGKSRAARAFPDLPTPTFKVVALGNNGSGKTVLLASLFYQFRARPGRPYYFDTDPVTRVQLGSLLSYRRFLDDESGYLTQTSLAFRLESGVVPFGSSAQAARARPSPPRPVRIAVLVGVAAVLAAAVGAALALVPPSAVNLRGTWAGADELGRGPVTVTVTCAPGCPEPQGASIGTVSYGACTYTLVLDRIAGSVLLAEVSRVRGTDCLPDTRVSLRREGGQSANLHWNDPPTDAALLQVHR